MSNWPFSEYRPKSVALLSLFLLLIGNVPSWGQEPQINQLITDSSLFQHRTVAILPLQVAVTASDFRKKQVLSPELVRREANRQGREAQALLGRHFADQDFRVTLQDTLETLRRLFGAGAELHRLGEYDPQDLCELLGVDAILTGRIHKIEPSKREIRPGGGGAQIPIGGFFVPVSPTNGRTKASFVLYDGKTGEEVWQTTDETVEHNLYWAWDNAQHLAKYLRAVTRAIPYPRRE